MITEIAEAVMLKFNASDLVGSLTGGLYFQQAAQDVSFPYGVFYFMGATQEEIMGAAMNSIAEIELQFNLFSSLEDGGTQIANISDMLFEVFHWQMLNISDYSYIKMQRESILPLTFIDEVWQSTSMFSLWMQKI